jgi:hypothetical protein
MGSNFFFSRRERAAIMGPKASGGFLIGTERNKSVALQE